MLDSDQLRTFLVVAESGSLRKAGQILHLTQPALSRQVRLLEERLGVLLFERTGRGMRLTDTGHRLVERATPLLQGLLELPEHLRGGPVRGAVSLGVSPSVGAVWTARLVERIRTTLPEVQLRVVFLLSGALSEVLARGGLDLGLLYTPTAGMGLVTENLWEEACYLVTAASCHPADKRSASIGAVLGERLILPSSHRGIRALLEEEATRRGRSLHVEVEVDSVQLALALVRRGLGSMLLTERALADLDRRAYRALRVSSRGLHRFSQVAATPATLRREAVRAVWQLCLMEHGSEDAKKSPGGGRSR